MSVFYAITVKFIKKGCFASPSEILATYCDFMRFTKGTHREYVFEKDSLERYHLHGTFAARKSLMASKFKKPYWHIYVKALDTDEYYENWVHYIHKDIQTDDAAVCKQIMTTYPFNGE